MTLKRKRITFKRKSMRSQEGGTIEYQEEKFAMQKNFVLNFDEVHTLFMNKTQHNIGFMSHSNFERLFQFGIFQFHAPLNVINMKIIKMHDERIGLNLNSQTKQMNENKNIKVKVKNTKCKITLQTKLYCNEIRKCNH